MSSSWEAANLSGGDASGSNLESRPATEPVGNNSGDEKVHASKFLPSSNYPTVPVHATQNMRRIGQGVPDSRDRDDPEE